MEAEDAIQSPDQLTLGERLGSFVDQKRKAEGRPNTDTVHASKTEQCDENTVKLSTLVTSSNM